MSLVLDDEDFFGQFGIYSNPNSRDEHPVSFEYFDPNTGDDFQVNAGPIIFLPHNPKARYKIKRAIVPELQETAYLAPK